MPRGGAPPYKRRLEPILDDYLYASVTQADGVHDPETGHYATLVYSGCESKERAVEISKALYRSGVHLGLSVKATVKRRGDVWDVEYRAIDKAHARRHVLEKYGPDRSKWPYDPRRKGR